MIYKLLEMRPIRFILVGILNTVFGYSIFVSLIFLGISNPIAMLCTSIIGILFNFKSIGLLVFNNNNNQLIYKFLFLYALIYLINITLLEAINHHINNIYFSGALSMLACALLSYAGNLLFIFKNNNDNLSSQDS